MLQHTSHTCHSSNESAVWQHDVYVHEYRYDPFGATKHDNLYEIQLSMYKAKYCSLDDTQSKVCIETGIES